MVDVLAALQRGNWTVSAWRCVWWPPVSCWDLMTFIWRCPRTMSGSCSALKTLAAQPRSRGTVLYVASVVGGFISQVNFSFMLIVSELQAVGTAAVSVWQHRHGAIR